MTEDVHIKFLFDVKTVGKRLKWKDIKKVQKFRHLKNQGADIDDEFIEQMQILACRFMADENNQYLPLEQAYEIFDELSQDEALDAINKFAEVFTESTIPNGSGEPSPSISQASSPTPTTSPIGSTQ
jgi:hypothetical protein